MSLLQTKPPAALRDELETLVIKDLLGPAGGPFDEIDESQITDRYFPVLESCGSG